MLISLSSLHKKYNMDITGVIHIGAHYGHENTQYNSLKIENRIFFEPVKSTFEVLKKNVNDKYLLINKALGNDNKKINMFTETTNRGQSSSILEPKLHLKQYSRIVFDGIEEVDMIRLDDSGLDLRNFNLINIDVQGYELEVFKGAVKTLENIDYIYSEINRSELYKDCTMVEQLVDFLKQFGFELVEENWGGNTWGDGLFIKRD